MGYISKENKNSGRLIRIGFVFSFFAILIFLYAKPFFVPNACAQGVYYPPGYGIQQGFTPFGLPFYPSFNSIYPAIYPGNFLGQSFPTPFYGPQGYTRFTPSISFAPQPGPQPFSGWSYPIQQPFPLNVYTPSGFTPYQFLPSQGWGNAWGNSFPPLSTSFPYPALVYEGLGYPGQRSNSTPSQDVSPLPRPKTLSEYPIPEDIPQKRKTALKDALDWIFNNPAAFTNNSAVEIGEEVMLFYQLYRRASEQEARDLCHEYIATRIKEIVDYGALNNTASGEISVLVPICDIVAKLGLFLFDYRAFINEKVLFNPGTYTPTHKIWNSSILEALGFYPPTPLTHLVSQGSIVAEFTSGQLLQLMDSPNADERFIMSRFYDIAHEIIPLAGFGEKPITILDAQQVSFLKNLITRGLHYFLGNPDIDILSELLICANMIDLADQALINEAYEYILDQQVADGSFGDISRLIEIGRSSPARHGVFVAVWALIQ